jgi:hypothetical protein
MRGVAYVNDKVVMEADLMAQIIKVKSAPSAIGSPVSQN